MKYLTVLAVLAVAFWIWRSNRAYRRSHDLPKSPNAQPSSTSTPVQAMLQCAHCGVHLPASDAVAGKQGRYCSAEHRAQLEG
jgi:uncharacterized protein